MRNVPVFTVDVGADRHLSRRTEASALLVAAGDSGHAARAVAQELVHRHPESHVGQRLLLDGSDQRAAARAG